MPTSVEQELSKYNSGVKKINTMTNSCAAEFFTKIEPHMNAFLKVAIPHNLSHSNSAYAFKPIQPDVSIDQQLFLKDEVYKPLSAIIEIIKNSDFVEYANCIKKITPAPVDDLNATCGLMSMTISKDEYKKNIDIIKAYVEKYGAQIKDFDKIGDKLEQTLNTLCPEQRNTNISSVVQLFKSLAGLITVCNTQVCPECPKCAVCPVPKPCPDVKTYKVELISVSVTFSIVCFILLGIILYLSLS